MSTALSLYALEENLVALLDTAEMVEEDQRLAVLSEIAQANDAAIAKRDNLVRFLRWLAIQQDGIKAEVERLQKLAAHYEKAQERVERYTVAVIQQFAPEPKRGAKRLDGNIGILAIRKNPDSCEVTDEAIVPNEYKALQISVPATVWEQFTDGFTVEQLVAFNNSVVPHMQASVKVDRAGIKRALSNGKTVPGAGMKAGAYRLEIK